MDSSSELKKQRLEMVEQQLRPRNIRSVDVLKAFEKVPRHLFVPPDLRQHAYEDRALPLGPGQTISQPYIVAHMLDNLRIFPGAEILEVGTGSGYQAALLSELGAKVYSVEINSALAETARERLKRLGYDGVEIIAGDGYQGWKEVAPFDGIVVSAAPHEVPRELVRQLKTDGRLILPLGADVQELILLIKEEAGLTSRELGAVRFVKMI